MSAAPALSSCAAAFFELGAGGRFESAFDVVHACFGRATGRGRGAHERML
jgi:hypothetical protein